MLKEMILNFKEIAQKKFTADSRTILFNFLFLIVLVQIILFFPNSLNVSVDFVWTIAAYRDPRIPPLQRAQDLLSRMTLEEKIGQLSMFKGTSENLEERILKEHVGSFLDVTGDLAVKAMEINRETRLKIPLLLGIDAIHGNCFIKSSTVFPTQLGYSTSWDEDLAFQIGNITAFEMRYSGPAWTFSPVACLARDLRWGRIDETFGEDPFLLGKLVVQLAKGLQGEELGPNPDKVLACAKHYVGYGETIGGLDAVEADLTHWKLLSFFMKPFQLLAEADTGTFMSGYHSIDGIPATTNKWLLKTMLKDKWQYKGFVITDWNNVGRLMYGQHIARNLPDAIAKSLNAGTDMSMATDHFLDGALQAIRTRAMNVDTIDEACLRVLETKIKMGLFEDERVPDQKKLLERTGTPEHRKVALEAALKSLVLLKNDGTLPLKKGEVKKILLLGENADNLGNQLGDWSLINQRRSFGVYERSTITTIKDALEKRLGEKITYSKGCTIFVNKTNSTNEVDDAMKLVENSDLVIIVVGDSMKYSGEAKSTATLQLMGTQEELIKRVAQTGKKFIIAVVSSKPLILPDEADKAAAILLQFNPGALGGEAFAQILFGESEPRGRLTLSIPFHVGQLPAYYQRPRAENGNGYADIAKPIAKYPFGYGLLYTNIVYVAAKLDKPKYSTSDTIKVYVKLQNNGERPGTEVVQCYVHIAVTSVIWPTHELKGFSVVTLQPHEEKTITIEIPVSELAIVNANEEYVVEPGEYDIGVGKSSKDIKHVLKFFIQDN